MTVSPILTARLELILESPEDARQRLDALPPEGKAALSPVWLARFHAATEPDPWVHGFVVRLRPSKEEIGAVGFKGPPEDGIVEIAYNIEPNHQGKGFATEAARAMAEYALGDQAVDVVRAHTLPEENASGTVLKKCGFTCLGEVIDPEDGPVWRWERGE